MGCQVDQPTITITERCKRDIATCGSNAATSTREDRRFLASTHLLEMNFEHAVHKVVSHLCVHLECPDLFMTREFDYDGNGRCLDDKKKNPPNLYGSRARSIADVLYNMFAIFFTIDSVNVFPL